MSRKTFLICASVVLVVCAFCTTSAEICVQTCSYSCCDIYHCCDDNYCCPRPIPVPVPDVEQTRALVVMAAVSLGLILVGMLIVFIACLLCPCCTLHKRRHHSRQGLVYSRAPVTLTPQQ